MRQTQRMDAKLSTSRSATTSALPPKPAPRQRTLAAAASYVESSDVDERNATQGPDSDTESPKRQARHSVHGYKSRAPKARQEGYYTEPWLSILKVAKKNAHCSLIANDAFPDNISLTCQNALADAVFAHELGELLYKHGMFVFPRFNISLMTPSCRGLRPR